MKNFLIALCAFILTTTAIIINSVMIDKSFDKMLDIINELPTDEETFLLHKSNADDLSELWEKDIRFISLTLNSREIEDAENFLYELKATIAGNEFSHYKSSRDQLKNLLEDLRDQESFSISSLF